MRKSILYIAVSLDGYIADRNGGVGWIGGDGSDPGNPGSYPAFFESTGAVVMGYTTYRQIVTELAPGRWDYAGKPTYVLTHRTLDALPEIEFTRESPEALVGRLRKMDGKPVWIMGGASVFQQLMRADLIDEIIVSVVPTVLGGGTRLFGEAAEEMKLALVDVRAYDGMVDLKYRRRG